MSRITAPLSLSLLASLSCLGSCTPDEPIPQAHVPVSVYSEFLAYRDVEAQLPAFAARRASLSIAVPDSRIGDPALASLLRAAKAQHVDMRIWLVLDLERGYWPNESNLAEFDQAITELLAWLAREELVASAVVFDMEPAHAYAEELLAAFSGTDLTAITELMATHIDPIAHDAARALLATLVHRVKDAGLRAECVTYPQVLDDMLDGDTDFQDALDIPVSGIDWDGVSFMVYQTNFAEAAGGQWLGAGLVRSYAEDARTYFGETAAIALGSVGRRGVFMATGPIYDEPSALAEDVGAALGAGIARVEIYSLDGMVEEARVTEWLEGSNTTPQEPPISASVRFARSLTQSFDRELDAPRE